MANGMPSTPFFSWSDSQDAFDVDSAAYPLEDSEQTPQYRPPKVALLDKVYSFQESRQLKSLGIYPYFREICSGQAPVVRMGHRDVVMLGSNNYLGLTGHPQVKRAAVEAVQIYGAGCAGSRLLNGTLDLHRLLEEELAELVGKEAAIVFSTGYQANLGPISSLVGRGEYIVTDKLDHASIVDGCRLSFGRMIRFRHNDMEALARVLENVPASIGKLVVVDGVFSMEGTIARLPEIAELCNRHGAALMVDDAHGIGVLGEGGAGTSDHFQVTDSVHVIMGTFSKALATVGGFVAGDEDMIEFIKHKARPLMFSASISPSNAAAARAALQVMKQEPERLARLWENTRRMGEGLRQLGFDTGESRTPIIPVRIGDMVCSFQACMLLQEEDVFVNPVVPPAVPEGDCLIRLSLTASHTFAHIDFALDKMEKVGRKLHVI
jgi:8-amino-7-oxononanoate synthase